MPRTFFPALLLASISVFTLSACGGRHVDENKSAAPIPPSADVAIGAPMPLSSSDTLAPVTLAPAAIPGTTDRKFVPLPGGAAAVAAPMSMEDRMTRLEESVGALRADYDRILPAFASLNTTNERIQALLDEMEGQSPTAQTASTTTVTTRTTQSPVTAAPSQAIKAAPAQETVVDETQTTSTTVTTATPVTEPAKKASAKTAGTDGKTVTALRVGEHGDKTRLVFDLSGTAKPDFKYDLDNSEHVLLIDMPALTWAGKEKGAPGSPLIAGWTAQKGASGGSTVAVQLKKDARILSTEFLKAEGANPARLVLDIAAGA